MSLLDVVLSGMEIRMFTKEEKIPLRGVVTQFVNALYLSAETSMDQTPQNFNMSKRVDLFDSTYSNFTEEVLDIIRKETFGHDIGQNSWLTVDEYESFILGLNLTAEEHVLDAASGAGGPAFYLANHVGCYVTGIDANESGIATATQGAAKSNQTDWVNFKLIDANEPLPFDDDSFDGIVCIDSMNHFTNRLSVLKEWRRILRPGRRAVFTDPVMIPGPVTNDELALRSLVGLFLFVPPGINEQLIEKAGFNLVQREDVTDNAILISDRWYQARERHRERSSKSKVKRVSKVCNNSLPRSIA